MSDQFVGELRLLPYNFAPRGWALCQGQLLQIASNTALFSLLGTNYGGNGTTNFGLPDLRDSAPIHWGNGPGLTSYAVGETGGATTVTLLSTEMARHTHLMGAVAGTATAVAPAVGAYPAEGQGGGRGGAFNIRMFSPAGTMTSLVSTSVGPAGSGAPHNNVQLSMAMSWCIALEGIYPARN